jgi:hypothetical protein
VIAASHEIAGPIWSLGETLIENARSAARTGLCQQRLGALPIRLCGIHRLVRQY